MEGDKIIIPVINKEVDYLKARNTLFVFQAIAVFLLLFIRIKIVVKS